MSLPLTVVLSQDQSTHPGRRAVEADVARGAAEAGCQTLVISHLYDLQPESPAVQTLRGIDGDLIVLAWLYPRAIHWTLDRHGIRGRRGRSELADSPPDPAPARDDGKERLAARRARPNRDIYCLDLRQHGDAGPYLAEICRLAQARGARPALAASGAREPILETGPRRWYPVIDFSRCTNCMECIDFCLFGVYGLDAADMILVEQPDNCRKGCPACSRVCPEHAIIFPQHKAAAIAGGPAEAGALKLDLSPLFGGNAAPSTAAEIATRERDEHLLASGRLAQGPAPLDSADQDPPPAAPAKDDLDRLIDRLDESDV